MHRPVTLFRARALTAGLVLLFGAGCRGDGANGALEPESGAYWALRFPHHAVTLGLAPGYDTAQMAAVPTNPAGVPLILPGAVTYTSSNTDVVTIDSTGLITALAPTFSATITARLEADGITHTDTALVAVTATLPGLPLRWVRFLPTPGDSAKFAIGGIEFQPYTNVPAIAIDSGGTEVFEVPLEYRSMDPLIAGIDPGSGLLLPLRPGTVRLTASALAYGQVLADTLSFRIGLPLLWSFQITPRLGGGTTFSSKQSSSLGVGATVSWYNSTGIPTDVTFDDTTNVAAADPSSFLCSVIQAPCDPGNIPPFTTSDAELKTDPALSDQNGLRARRFTAPGIYTFRSTLFGDSAQVIIVDDSQ